MADIIDLSSRLKPGVNLITAHPLEFRKGEWLAGSAIVCTRSESDKFESHRQRLIQSQDKPYMSLVPNHITLDGGYHFTVAALFRFREEEPLMRRLYRLAGLMECATKAPSPILRTDLVRRFFKIINEEKMDLNVSWRGNVRNFLLPLFPNDYNPNVFLNAIESADSLKELLLRIEEETGKQFDLLAGNYVFYVPESFYAR
ncbi:MAG: hypothetical protein LLG06_10970 [Desulfobacteraceae bacterium]|nr:hypothetical protein [Desulfobacteraceae bacterium]